MTTTWCTFPILLHEVAVAFQKRHSICSTNSGWHCINNNGRKKAAKEDEATEQTLLKLDGMKKSSATGDEEKKRKTIRNIRVKQKRYLITFDFHIGSVHLRRIILLQHVSPHLWNFAIHKELSHLPLWNSFRQSFGCNWNCTVAQHDRNYWRYQLNWRTCPGSDCVFCARYNGVANVTLRIIIIDIKVHMDNTWTKGKCQEMRMLDSRGICINWEHLGTIL